MSQHILGGVCKSCLSQWLQIVPISKGFPLDIGFHPLHLVLLVETLDRGVTSVLVLMGDHGVPLVLHQHVHGSLLYLVQLSQFVLLQ